MFPGACVVRLSADTVTTAGPWGERSAQGDRHCKAIYDPNCIYIKAHPSDSKMLKIDAQHACAWHRTTMLVPSLQDCLAEGGWGREVY